jgi:arsenate reductase
LLGKLGADFDGIDIVKNPPSRAELARALKLAGVPVKKLFNTSGQSYREGGFGARLASMSESAALDALARDGKLIKRPLVLGRDFALVGFDERAYRARFG